MTKKIYIIFAVLLGLSGLSACTHAQTTANEGILRLHVIANSNSVFDQNVKLKVKDEVSVIMAQRGITSYEDAMDMVMNEREYIEGVVKSVLKEEGVSYGSTMEVGNYHFPEKTYGTAVFKEGNYNAVRIKLGNASGENWWCVMFPPICFIDSGSDWDISNESNVEFKSLLSAFIK